VDDWNGDVVLLDQLLDDLINLDILSIVELDGSLGKENIALLVNLCI